MIFTFTSFDLVYADETFKERYIIHFNDGIDYQLLEPFSYELHHELELIDRLAVSVSKKTAEKIERLRGVSVEKDEIVKVDQQFVGYHHQLIKNDTLEYLSLTGKGVKVAVLDTGIKTDHPDLVVSGGVNTIDDQLSFEDDNGHGTHVAGIIAATDNDFGVVGISPDVELYAIKALDANGEGTQTDIIAGIQWAVEHEMDIINLSITTPISTDAFESMLTYSYAKGIISVAASGNDYRADTYPTQSVTYPAKYPSVIAVGSIDEYDQPSYFSQPGKALEFVAPGEFITSTFNDPEYLYVEMSGTSMATPVVTAVLSLYKEAYPTLSAEALRLYAQTKAKDLGRVGRDELFGFGLIQKPTDYFLDVTAGYWYYNAVQQGVKNKVIEGYEGSLFKPNRSVSRAEFAALLGRILIEEPTSGSESKFNDVDTTLFAYPYIEALSNMSVISGYPDQTFRPAASITRGEVAVMLYRAFDHTYKSDKFYSDIFEEAFYYEAVLALSNERVLSGYPDGLFKPNQSMTRAEVANVLHLLALKKHINS